MLSKRRHVTVRLFGNGFGTVLPDVLVGISRFVPAETQARF